MHYSDRIKGGLRGYSSQKVLKADAQKLEVLASIRKGGDAIQINSTTNREETKHLSTMGLAVTENVVARKKLKLE